MSREQARRRRAARRRAERRAARERREKPAIQRFKLRPVRFSVVGVVGFLLFFMLLVIVEEATPIQFYGKYSSRECKYGIVGPDDWP